MTRRCPQVEGGAATLSGVFNALAWGQAALYAAFTVLFVMVGRASMSSRAGG